MSLYFLHHCLKEYAKGCWLIRDQADNNQKHHRYTADKKDRVQDRKSLGTMNIQTHSKYLVSFHKVQKD
jgi:hypothetical protein